MKEVTFDFTGKNFVVVGASSGMGRQITLELAASGAKVLAVARKQEKLTELKQHNSENIIIVSLDVTKAKKQEWTSVFDNFVSKYGKLDGGVYTAGISGITPLRLFQEEEARNIMETSFWGMLFFMQGIVRKKYINSSSSFVVFSSTAATWGNKGMFAYSAAKSAMRTAVRSLAKEISKDKHRLNSVSPGYVGGTGMTSESAEFMGLPENVIKQHYFGIGRPSDVSGVVLFLLSDRAGWITGTDIVVDGGYLLGGND